MISIIYKNDRFQHPNDSEILIYKQLTKTYLLKWSK